MDWPKDSQRDLESFYSVHSLRSDGRPTTAWEKAHLVTVQTPFPLTLAWDLSREVRRMTCHRLVAESLQTILRAVLTACGDLDGVRRNRMHLYGGCYNYRRVSGSSRLSTHAWGVGVDLDPERNPLGKKYDGHEGMMPEFVVAIFETEGWTWGGRFQTRPDCMHFQATS